MLHPWYGTIPAVASRGEVCVETERSDVHWGCNWADAILHLGLVAATLDLADNKSPTAAQVLQATRPGDEALRIRCLFTRCHGTLARLFLAMLTESQYGCGCHGHRCLPRRHESQEEVDDASVRAGMGALADGGKPRTLRFTKSCFESSRNSRNSEEVQSTC
jgi:hypothetical protein